MGWWDQHNDQEFIKAVGPMPLFAGQIVEEESLNRMIIDHLEETDRKIPRSVKRKAGFHASAFGYWCGRFEVLRRSIQKASDGRRFPGSLLLRFNVGTAIHEHWQQEIFAKMRVLKGRYYCSRCLHKIKDAFLPDNPCPKCAWPINPATEQPAPRSRSSVACADRCKWPGGFQAEGRDCAHCERGGRWTFRETSIYIEEWDIVGFYDGLILYNAIERLLELKSKDSFAWENLEAPHPEHVSQAQVYMWGSGIHETIICYMNKNSGTLKEFLVKFDPAAIELIKKNISRVWKALDNGELPTGTCGSPKEKRAKECAYCSECFKGIDNIEELKEALK